MRFVFLSGLAIPHDRVHVIWQLLIFRQQKEEVFIRFERGTAQDLGVLGQEDREQSIRSFCLSAWIGRKRGRTGRRL